MPEALSSEGWTGPLSGLRVLDFGQAAVGPIAVEYLGWLGADAIKVESPRGDTVRGTRPMLRGTGHTFLGNNLNKRGVVLDLKDPAGHAQALRLIGSADVLVENFRSPEVMRRLGLGYELLREHNPRLIYLQSSAYGPRGPMHGMTSNEWFSQAAAGLTSVTGEAGGRQEFSRGTATLDWGGAFTNLQAILVALYVRERTGRGTFIQTSQLQSTIAGATSRIAEYFASGRAPGTAPGPMGSARPNIVPDQVFACADGYVAVPASPTTASGRSSATRSASASCATIPRFATNSARVERRDELLPILEACFRAAERRGVGAPPARGGRAGRGLPARPDAEREPARTPAGDRRGPRDGARHALRWDGQRQAALALRQDRGADHARRPPPRRAHRRGARRARRGRRERQRREPDWRRAGALTAAARRPARRRRLAGDPRRALRDAARRPRRRGGEAGAALGRLLAHDRAVHAAAGRRALRELAVPAVPAQQARDRRGPQERGRRGDPLAAA